jgi:hypothetical protein
MDEPRAQRTLVKSPPELWAEISDVEALAPRLGAFGEIRITRTEPETTVAWEGDRARGTVELEPSGWGTKVTLTAAIESPPDTVVAIPEPAPPVVAEAVTPRRGFFARLFARRPAEAPPPVADVEIGPVRVQRTELDPGRAEEILSAVLDDLGSAHHRPFSR